MRFHFEQIKGILLYLFTFGNVGTVIEDDGDVWFMIEGWGETMRLVKVLHEGDE